jgi:hypothetical protein
MGMQYTRSFIFAFWGIVFLTACSDPEGAFRETLAGFDTFFMRYIDISNYPKQERANREMVLFLEKNRAPLVKGLSTIAELRNKKPLRYWELHEKNRQSIVSSFRRLEAIDKKERILFSVYSLVFSPEPGTVDMQHFAVERDMFATYLDVILADSRPRLD